MLTRDQVLDRLREVVDPEIGISLVDLGLIRKVQVEDDRVHVEMLLTIPGCPLARYLVGQVESTVRAVAEGRSVDVQLLDEPWDPASMFWRGTEDQDK